MRLAAPFTVNSLLWIPCLADVVRRECNVRNTSLETMFLKVLIEFVLQHSGHYHRLSQLYGSTTVVMPIYGLHWKWRSFTPCQRQASEPSEKKFGTIDHVIDLNNLAKFGSGKFFGGWGTYTQHISVRAFFKNFLCSWVRVQPKRLNRVSCAISQMTPFGERRCHFYKEKYRFMTLTFERSNSAILFGLQNFDRHFLENGTR